MLATSWPWPRVCDRLGDGGGSVSESATVCLAIMASREGRTEEDDPRCCLTPLDLALTELLTDAASDLSANVDEPFPARAAEDDRGLSDFPLPGILERSWLRSEREDSLVSERLKEGY